MKAAERRAAVLARLEVETGPVSATVLAKEFSVSRQIIVGDVALLRAAGEDISATPRGYIYSRSSKGLIRKIAVRHASDRTEEELNLCVDHGCVVQDVIVEHPVYGQIVGELQLESRYDVGQFIDRVRQEKLHSLSELTDGIHLHTLQCRDEASYRLVCEALDEAGILLKEEM